MRGDNGISVTSRELHGPPASCGPAAIGPGAEHSPPSATSSAARAASRRGRGSPTPPGPGPGRPPSPRSARGSREPSMSRSCSWAAWRFPAGGRSLGSRPGFVWRLGRRPYHQILPEPSIPNRFEKALQSSGGAAGRLWHSTAPNTRDSGCGRPAPQAIAVRTRRVLSLLPSPRSSPCWSGPVPPPPPGRRRRGRARPPPSRREPPPAAPRGPRSRAASTPRCRSAARPP